MKIYTELTQKVTVITKNATPYDVDGNKGITYRLVVMKDNDVEKIKVVDEKAYNLFQSGQEYLLTGEFDIRNARCSEWKVNGFKK
ncbi:hypothetical protein [Blautia intestinalis]|uniref:hypothetical protein n=1 Tax=Blautia intestinalis TaxID=2763028 RepID=UPI0022E96A21|nr:hypothetical protein [Blautia intestinalis]